MTFRTNLPPIDFTASSFTRSWTVSAVDWSAIYSQIKTASGFSCFSGGANAGSGNVWIQWRYRSDGWNLNDFNYCRAQLGLDGLRYAPPETPPPFTIEDVLLMTNNAGHPTIGGLRVDEIFSECFQQSTTVLDDGRFVYDATAYANDNHSECIGVAQIVLDYKSSNTLDFQAWQVAALPLLSLFFVVYAGLRLGVGR